MLSDEDVSGSEMSRSEVIGNRIYELATKGMSKVDEVASNYRDSGLVL
jgi:hypothetical protein